MKSLSPYRCKTFIAFITVHARPGNRTQDLFVASVKPCEKRSKKKKIEISLHKMEQHS